MRLALVLGCGLVITACHKPPEDPGTMVDGQLGSGSDVDGSVPPGFTMLVQRGWSMTSGTEGYRCVRVQVPEDMWITAFRSLAPLGTHHSVLTISTTSTQLGEYDCNAGTLDTQMLYAAGVGTDDNEFPPGVAIHVAAGTYVNLNLHLFNTTENTLTGTSGVLVKTIPQSQVVSEADMQFSGTFNITVPADGMPHVATGTCAAASDFHVFTLWPHMHQIATHQRLTVSGATNATLLDVDYAFTDQKNYPMADTLVHAHDTITTTCTYVNPMLDANGQPNQTVKFGDSSTAEMCFTGIYRYPAGGNLFACAYGQPISGAVAPPSRARAGPSAARRARRLHWRRRAASSRPWTRARAPDAPGARRPRASRRTP